jgi:ubiquinone/menaquinone biosynthesis C-methylase UbiE
MEVNAQYNVSKPGSLPVKIAEHQHRKMFAAFLRHAGIGEGDTVLDVGATSNRSYEHSNYLEAWLPHNRRVTAVGIDDASFLTAAHPGLTFVRADGRTLPFKDASFDFVQPSAVLEHVGSRKGQTIFLVELWRWLAKACS